MALNINEKKRYCFIQEDGQSVLTSCLAKQLEAIECQDSRDFILNSAIQAHHKVYGNGTRTLLKMTKLWLEEMENLSNQGVPKRVILKGFTQAVELCCDNLDPITVRLNDLFPSSLDHFPRTETIPLRIEKSNINNYENKFKPLNCKLEKLNGNQSLIAESTSPDGINSSDEFTEVDLIFQSEPMKLEKAEFQDTNQPIEMEATKGGDLISPIELKMKMPYKAVRKEYEEEEDIGWFFDDGQVPPAPEMDPSLIEMMAPVNFAAIGGITSSNNEIATLNKPNGYGHQSPLGIDESWKNSSNNGLEIENIKYTNIAFKSICFKNKHTESLVESDDEFSSCFDDVKTDVVVHNASEISGHTKTNSNKLDNTSGLGMTAVYDQFDAVSFIPSLDKSKTQLPKCNVNTTSPKDKFSILGVEENKLKHGKEDIMYSTLLSRNDGSNDEFDTCFSNEGTGSEDEFDSCFSNEDIVAKSQIDSNSEKNDQKSFKKGNTTDEYSATKFSDENNGNTSCESVVLKSKVEQKIDHKKLNSDPSNNYENLMNKDNNTDIENKLQNLLNKKKSDLKSVILNKSRHFKCVDSTVEELKGGIFTFNCKNKVDSEFPVEKNIQVLKPIKVIKTEECLKSMNSNLEKYKTDIGANQNNEVIKGSIDNKLRSILNCRSSSGVKSRVLNSSRHFKTIQSTSVELQDNLSSDAENEGSLLNTNKCEDKDDVSMEQTMDIIQIENKDTEHTVNSYSQKQFINQLENCKLDEQPNGNTSDVGNVLKRLIGGLSHGEEQWVECIYDIIRNQSGQLNNIVHAKLNLLDVHTIPTVGPLSAGLAQVHNGLLVEVKLDQLGLIHKNIARKLNCIIINGDLSPNYKHLGYKMDQTVKRIHSSVTVNTKEQLWIEEAMEIIEELDVSLILVKGTANFGLTQACFSKNVILLSGVPYKVLKAVADSCEVLTATYIVECSQVNVADDIQLSPLRTDWMCINNPNAQFAVITCFETPIQTVVFQHPLMHVALDNEESFLHVCHRVSSSLQYSKVLYGGGKAEYHCYKFLCEQADEMERKWTNTDHLFQEGACLPVVYRGVAKGFLHFYLFVQKNHGCNNNNLNIPKFRSNNMCDNKEKIHSPSQSNSDFVNSYIEKSSSIKSDDSSKFDVCEHSSCSFCDSEDPSVIHHIENMSGSNINIQKTSIINSEFSTDLNSHSKYQKSENSKVLNCDTSSCDNAFMNQHNKYLNRSNDTSRAEKGQFSSEVDNSGKICKNKNNVYSITETQCSSTVTETDKIICDKCNMKTCICDDENLEFDTGGFGTVYDDYNSKTECWFSACQLAVQIFNTDMEIITGQGVNKYCSF